MVAGLGLAVMAWEVFPTPPCHRPLDLSSSHTLPTMDLHAYGKPAVKEEKEIADLPPLVTQLTSSSR
jgi:hypothetical protein